MSFQEEGRGSLRQTQEEGETGATATSQGLLEAARSWKRQGSIISLAPSKRTVLILDFWPSKPWAYISVVLRHSMCGNLLWQPEETATHTHAHTHMCEHTQVLLAYN